MTDRVAITDTAQRKGRKQVSAWFLGLLLLAVIVRVLLLLTYQPVEFGDSGSYLRLAEAIRGVGDRGYDGTRVPGYLVFMALWDMRPDGIWLAQMVLGLLISIMLYWIATRLSDNEGLGFLLGAFYSLIPGQLLFEAALLTETLTTFFIVASVACLVGLKYSDQDWRSYALAALTGFTASGVGLTRPLFFPITLLLLPFVWWLSAGSRLQRLSVLGVYALLPLMMQGGWLLYMGSHWHVVSPTAMAGYSMVQHTGSYFEYLPDQYAAIRDTYIQYRDAQIAAREVQTNAIWDAIPAISKASGLGFYDLSREMGRLSWLLIRGHPGLYFQNVVEGWIAFWKAPVYWQPDLVHPAAARAVLQMLAVIGRGISILANLGFLVLTVVTLFVPRLRRYFSKHPVILAGASMVWVISILQTLLDHGDNPRFLVPLQMILFFVIIMVLESMIHAEEVGSYAE